MAGGCDRTIGKFLRAEPPLGAMKVTISADQASAALEAVINFQLERRQAAFEDS
jgi:hypothetical protein